MAGEKSGANVINGGFFLNVNNAVNLFFVKTAYSFIISSFSFSIFIFRNGKTGR